VAGGLALLSKYTAFFLGAGALAWIAFAPEARRWLLSPWPYLGAVAALAIFAPNVWWNATHHWMTFVFQFGRVGAGRFTLRFLAELLGAQLLLATPFIFLCGSFGFSRRIDKSLLLLMTVLPATAYFVAHSLHDRVQGNWPCFLYPALAVAAAGAMLCADWSGWRAPILVWSRRLAIPLASVLLALCYLQAFFGVLPIGRSDPFTRLLAFGFPNIVQHIQAFEPRPAAILTTDYETTAWLSFYSNLPVVQLDDEQRWSTSPPANANLLTRPLLYVAPQGKDRNDFLAAHFWNVWLLDSIGRMRNGQSVEKYALFEVKGLKGPPLGRVP